jgi:hypothetical protein
MGAFIMKKKFLTFITPIISILIGYIICLIFFYPVSQWIGIATLLLAFYQRCHKKNYVLLIVLGLFILAFNIINIIFWIDFPKNALNNITYSCSILKKHDASYYNIHSFENESPQTTKFVIEQIGNCEIYQGSHFLFDNLFNNYKPLKLPYDPNGNYLANSARGSLVKLYPNLSFLNEISDYKINYLYNENNNYKTVIEESISNNLSGVKINNTKQEY